MTMSGDPEVAPDTAPQPTGRRNAHLRKSVGDMVRSMAVVLALVFVIVLLAWRPLPEEVKTIDPGPAIGMAVAQADFPIVAPASLADEWRPTSARWESTTESGDSLVLHIGYVSPSDEYAQMSVSRSSTERYLREQTSGGAPTGTRDIGGVVWQEWESDDRRSLVLTDGDVTTLVSGTGDWAEIETLAAALQPAT